jgi:ABC-type oligopeptide transport system substrate-binding subunit
MRYVDRRTLLALAPTALASCVKETPYFGNTQPPSRQELTCAITASSITLDPALAGGGEAQVVRTIFEGLTDLHPRTVEPVAAIATHYDLSPDGLYCKLFLRGHADPRGAPLPNLRGNNGPARWTDGPAVTSHDFVYAWRRVVDPATAAMCAYLLNCVENAAAITSGKLPPDKLGVRAIDDFCLRVDLVAPTPFFLQLLSWVTLFPLPRHLFEQTRTNHEGRNWTDPDVIVTNGPFRLAEHRSRDRITVQKNPEYYDSPSVRLDNVSFLLTQETAAAANLYKSGRAHLMPGLDFPPLMAPTLSRKRDFCRAPAFGTNFPCFNVQKAPFDNVLLRYALNMAADKRALANVFGFGRQPAHGLVPPLAGYPAPTNVFVNVKGVRYDVLEYNPKGARELLAAAGYPKGRDPGTGRPLTFDLLYPNFQETRLKAEILQSQWQSELSVRINVKVQEFKTFLQNQFSLNYAGIVDSADWGYYRDQIWFLSEFTTGASTNIAGWSDPRYDSMLANATATLDPLSRMEKLAHCERYLLGAMPFMPMYHDVWAYPQKPYVRGISPNVMDVHPLKYAWIDTNWRPA